MISCKKLKDLIKEEKSASKEYRHYGWKKQSKDEASHSKFITKIYKRKC